MWDASLAIMPFDNGLTPNIFHIVRGKTTLLLFLRDLSPRSYTSSSCCALPFALSRSRFHIHTWTLYYRSLVSITNMDVVLSQVSFPYTCMDVVLSQSRFHMDVVLSQSRFHIHTWTLYYRTLVSIYTYIDVILPQSRFHIHTWTLYYR